MECYCSRERRIIAFGWLYAFVGVRRGRNIGTRVFKSPIGCFLSHLIESVAIINYSIPSCLVLHNITPMTVVINPNIGSAVNDLEYSVVSDCGLPLSWEDLQSLDNG